MSDGEEHKGLVTAMHQDLGNKAKALESEIATLNRKIEGYSLTLEQHHRGEKVLGDEARLFYGQQLPLLQKQLDALQAQLHDVQERLKPIEQALLQASSGK